MITINQILCHFSTDLKSGFLPPGSQASNLLFFDIETTGLSPKTSRVFLIGLIRLTLDSSSFETVQFLSENMDDAEETAILKAFSACVKSRKYLVHFNGTSFDIPYLIHRYEALGLEHPFAAVTQIDLYRELLCLPAFFRQMENHRQKSFETLVRYPRRDTLSGKEMIKLYHNYVNNRNPDILQLLLLHNYDDLAGMTALLPLGELKKLYAGKFTISDIKEITETSITGNPEQKLLFTLTLEQPLPAQLSASCSFCYITVLNSLVKIKMPLLEGTLKYFYRDYRNYYYLPYEDEAVHKSVGIYIDPSHREKAKASNCYKKFSGNFLYAPGSPAVSLFKENYASKEQYTLWPMKDSSPEALHSYIHEILKTAITEK